ncbi:V-type proton ATPase subunit G-like [Gigantopelta aegis]|uniref:V-type proton ATPase subunit G-like n=1 Tax=Gigantopelta aegis TaxID=1735272 RepID=UPI001B88AAA6|nr:V-type proton ATPase subunit G-like [Gigantopelta aegis]
MASQTAGIQQLLAAEKRAAEKVAEARRRKASRLKQAKKEADTDINAYRTEREKQYKDYEARVLGSRGDMEHKIEEGTRINISELNENVRRNKETALKRLLEIVYDIKPKLHQNLQL